MALVHKLFDTPRIFSEFLSLNAILSYFFSFKHLTYSRGALIAQFGEPHLERSVVSLSKMYAERN